jgi:transposase-like protein
MTPATADLPRTRRTYDHRFREQVVRCGASAVARHVHIPRSTASSWRRRGVRPELNPRKGTRIRAVGISAGDLAVGEEGIRKHSAES